MKENNLNSQPFANGGRYVNPYTDFGFKLLFGTVANKDLLIGFLNALLDLKSPIKDITYNNVEQQGDTAVARKAVFDVFCTSESGDKFIVEMQKAEQNYFIDRSIYYASFPIRDQATRGHDWNFKLTKVYTIGILNFIFDDDNEYYHHDVMLMDTKTKKVFYDKLEFVYLEMPKFNKDISDCKSFLDKWMFVLKNLTSLLDRPVKLQQKVFKQLFEAAEVARFTPQQKTAYEESLKTYRDLVNVVDTAMEKGLAKGLAKGRAEGLAEGLAEGEAKGMRKVAINMKKKGFSIEQIATATNLPIDEIKGIE